MHPAVGTFRVRIAGAWCFWGAHVSPRAISSVSLENPVFGETPRQPPAVTHMLPRAFAKRADDAACY